MPAFLQANNADPPPPSTKSSEPVSTFALDLLIAAALSAATFLLYLPSLSNNFVGYDDPLYVTDNPVVKQGLTLHGIRWAFTTGKAVNWLPMVWLSHMATVSLFGLNPAWHHAANAALHAFNAGLVFLVLGSMSGRRWPAVLVAALFAFHPLRVESVAWVSERKDVLSGLFFLLTLLAYMRYVRCPGILRHGVVLALYAAALMSKTVVVTLPFLLLLLDVWPLNRGRWSLRTLAEKVPMLLLASIASAWTFVLQRRGHAMTGQRLWSVGQRVANAEVSVARYLGKMFWPAHLSVFYPHPGSWPGWAVIASSALIVIVTLVAWRIRGQMPFVLIGWLWFLGMLVPVSGIVQVGLQSMADRYTYLPSIGLSIALVWAGDLFVRTRPAAKLASALFAAVVLLALASATWMREFSWHTTLTLFRAALDVEEQNWMAHDWVGMELDRKGDAAALGHFQRAAELNRLHPYPVIHMGAILGRLGKKDRALALFHKGVELAPDLSASHKWLAIGLTQNGDYADADREFATAARLDPDDPAIPVAWALSMVLGGQRDRARMLIHTALDLDPAYPGAIDLMKKLDQPSAGTQRTSTNPTDSTEPK